MGDVTIIDTKMSGCEGITAAFVVQGWYGGALVHGIDHMNW